MRVNKAGSYLIGCLCSTLRVDSLIKNEFIVSKEVKKWLKILRTSINEECTS